MSTLTETQNQDGVVRGVMSTLTGTQRWGMTQSGVEGHVTEIGVSSKHVHCSLRADNTQVLIDTDLCSYDSRHVSDSLNVGRAVCHQNFQSIQLSVF